MPASLSGEPPSPLDEIENGRLYSGFRKGLSMFPCDEDEKDKMDIFHKLFLVARRGILHSAQLTRTFHAREPGPRILDLGTGTGWVIDMADKYQNAYIRGYDLTFTQPRSIPPNIDFRQRDIQDPWLDLALECWDLIHIRMLNGAIDNWSALYQKVHRYLRPGYGWLEYVEIDWIPRFDDETLPLDSSLLIWAHSIIAASNQAHRSFSCKEATRTLLNQHGFVEIQEQVMKVSLNPWPTDPHLKNIGKWFCLGLIRGIEGITLRPLTKYAEPPWSKDQVAKLCQDVRRRSA